MKEFEFIADKVKLSGPKVDGSWSVTFEVGEYQVEKLATLLTLKDKAIMVSGIELNES